MIDIDNYFDNVWDHCQHIENKQTFEEVSFGELTSVTIYLSSGMSDG